MKFATKTPGKLIILGEYSVLEGAPSLVASTNRFANAIFKKSEDGVFKIKAPSINVPLMNFFISDEGKVKFIDKSFEKVMEKLSLFVAIFEQTARKLIEKGLKIPPLEIFLDTYDFYYTKNLLKLGLGSSAAVTVSLITGLLSANIVNPDEVTPELIMSLAMDSHKKAQGNVGSGIDIVTAIYGGILKYQIAEKEIRFKQLEMPDNLHYITVWSGQSASTSGFVKKFNQYKKNYPEDFSKLVQEMSHTSELGIEAFEKKDNSAFLEQYDAYYYLLKYLNTKLDLPVITKEHQQIYDICRSNNVYYKSSGAGGGDLGIAFANSRQEIDELKIELSKFNFDTIEIKFGSPGITAITNEVKEYAQFSYS